MQKNYKFINWKKLREEITRFAENVTAAINVKILQKKEKGFKCLLNGHAIKNCRANYECF